MWSACAELPVDPDLQQAVQVRTKVKIMVADDWALHAAGVQDRRHLRPFGEVGHDAGVERVSAEERQRAVLLQS